MDQTADLPLGGYCWGGDQPLKATTKNIAMLSSVSGFLFEELPKTLRDACLVTRLLGHRYIWIDALCIVQDDPADKAREIPKMRDVYRGALLTITASRASSVSQGFLQDRASGLIKDGCVFRFRFGMQENSVGSGNSNEAGHAPGMAGAHSLSSSPQSLQKPTKIQGSVVLFLPTFAMSNERLQEALQTRAWAFQERLLSSRVLDFGSFQTSLQDETTGRSSLVDGGWVTNKTTTDSLGALWDVIRQTAAGIVPGDGQASPIPLYLPDPLGRMSTDRLCDDEYQSKVWAVALQEYAKLHLTVSSDKLAAVEGLAEWFGLWLKASRAKTAGADCNDRSQETPNTSSNPSTTTGATEHGDVRYLAGMWSHQLPAGLMWRVHAKGEDIYVKGDGVSSFTSGDGQQDGFGSWG
ncbi:heterokaryon incompatibility protein-domain-containing protein [Microdochium trichocladiopsis]|uniref:Heterokaryon incompatibility protein-domain-containing protein n=1 Tax=Microdochium trichocladiopsis TaxID=1682393 RepID=A0A9P8YAF2_9PEZI|nr:heterokaryon incompatibility protein-domain-containing protein [Microdochium trichocladiopsis]KAH7034657.1 heterokaryon incompatibility protein-domain-containing protein [Microdochium trichocladiopsis]